MSNIAQKAPGVITGYHAAVDLAALGRGFEVLLHVEMGLQDRATLQAFEAEIARIDEITQLLSGPGGRPGSPSRAIPGRRRGDPAAPGG